MVSLAWEQRMGKEEGRSKERRKEGGKEGRREGKKEVWVRCKKKRGEQAHKKVV